MSTISEIEQKVNSILPDLKHLEPDIRVDGYTTEDIHNRQLILSIPIQYVSRALQLLEPSGIQPVESKQYSHGRIEFILAQEQINISKQ